MSGESGQDAKMLGGGGQAPWVVIAVALIGAIAAVWAAKNDGKEKSPQGGTPIAINVNPTINQTAIQSVPVAPSPAPTQQPTTPSAQDATAADAAPRREATVSPHHVPPVFAGPLTDEELGEIRKNADNSIGACDLPSYFTEIIRTEGRHASITFRHNLIFGTEASRAEKECAVAYVSKHLPITLTSTISILWN